MFLYVFLLLLLLLSLTVISTGLWELHVRFVVNGVSSTSNCIRHIFLGKDVYRMSGYPVANNVLGLYQTQIDEMWFGHEA